MFLKFNLSYTISIHLFSAHLNSKKLPIVESK